MIPFSGSQKDVSAAAMSHIYSLLSTPYKVGAVLKLPDYFTDSPTVIMSDECFVMYSISISKDVSVSGYETHAYTSHDLMHWKKSATILRRKNDGSWDSKQCAGYAAFCDPVFLHEPVQERISGRLWLSYLAGNSDGYEPDPLYMGMCFHDSALSEDVLRLSSPILRPDDPDIRPFEDKTLYKSCMLSDRIGASCHAYINVYNAKGHDDRERIYLAVSDDGIHWERYGDRAAIDNTGGDNIISGDPQIIMIDDMYVMLYFRYDRGKGAYNTFAASYDLVNWTRWERTPLIYPEHDFENVHAHKPWLITHDGVVYHFYCACNKRHERFIALATSKEIL